jgi:CRISPR-associated endonuclease/helicase Cas3
LSKAARSVWAKSLDDVGGWLPLWQHMDDSADVAVLMGPAFSGQLFSG